MRFALPLATLVLLAGSACSPPKKVSPADRPNQGKVEGPKQGDAQGVPGLPLEGAQSEGAPDVPDLRASPFPLTLWAAFLADRDYVDPSRFSNNAQMDAALAAMEAQAPKLFARRDAGALNLWIGDWHKRYPMPQKPGMRGLSELLVKILRDAVPVLGLEGKKRHELEYAAFNGLLEPLDPHTKLLTPEQNASLGVRTRGHFGGIGAEIWSENRRIRIVRVLPDNPAEKAGLMDNDLLYQIDGRSTVNMAASEAQRLLRGPVDSQVKVVVRREKQLRTLTINRGKITIPAVRAFELPDKAKTGYVELLSFQENSAQDTLEAMQAQLNGGASALVLDLRRNSGGLLTEALALVDGFVESGELISVISREGREIKAAKPKISISKDVPLVVLISQSSASASEIVSGALGTLGRAVVVGRRSFGKGSVQQLMPSKPYGEELALKVTVAEYRVAKDTKIQGRGVVPDLALYPMRLGDHRGVGAFFDIERFEQARETSVYNRKKGDKTEPSRFQLLYLARTPWEKFPRDLKDRAQRAWLDPELRIAAGLSQRLAKAVKGTGRDEVIAQFVREQRGEEEQSLVAALKRWKIDWRPGKKAEATQNAGLELQTQIVGVETLTNSGKTKKLQRRKQIDTHELRVGDIFTLRLRLKNAGSKDLHQLHLRTEYFLPELDDLEVVFGKLAAKATSSIDLRLQIPPGRSAHVGTYKFDVFSGSKAKTPILEQDLKLEFAPARRPELQFNYWIVDSARAAKQAPARPKRESIQGEAPFVVQGNGDGRVNPGEKVLIAFELINRGPSTASLPSIVVRNRSREQALLEEGAAPLDSIGPNKRMYGAIAMAVSKQADPHKPIDLQLMVGDRQTSQVVQREVHLPIQTPVDDDAWVALKKGYWASSIETLDLRAAPSMESAVLGRITPKDSVFLVGHDGDFVAMDVGKGRVLWAKGAQDAFKFSTRPRTRRLSPGLASLRAMVVPPQLDLEVPRVSSEGSITLKGEASDDVELDELVLWTIPEDPEAHAKKLMYRAVEKTATGEARTRIPFESKVELVPGPQRIRVIVRDSDEVETERDYWVYRSAKKTGAELQSQ